MDDAPPMAVNERVEHGQTDARGLRLVERTVGEDDVGEGSRRNQLHDDPGQALVADHVVRRDDVWMVPQPGGVAGFPPGPLDSLQIIRATRQPDLLEGDLGVERFVERAPHRSHPARAQPFLK